MKITPIKPKAKKCTECGTEFMPFKSTDKTCASHDCKTVWALKVVRKRNAAKEKEQRKLDHEKRKSLKTLSQWKNDLQKVINAIVREIDKGHPCIATGSMNGKRNSGHYIAVGANDTIRFHLENAWVQSEYSNSFKSGDTINYQNGIVSLYGKEYLDRLNALKMIKPIKLSIPEIQLIYLPRAMQELRNLKKSNEIYSTERRLTLRQEINERIGIYSNGTT